MAKKSPKKLVIKYYEEAWKKLSTDWLHEFYHDDAVLFGSLGTIEGADGIKDRIDSWHSMIKDVEIVTLKMCSDKENVMVHWMNKDDGETLIHGGKEVVLIGIDRFKFKESKVIFQWSFSRYYDLEENPYDNYKL